MIDFAICPIEHPSAIAASADVAVPSGNVLGSGTNPIASHASNQRSCPSSIHHLYTLNPIKITFSTTFSVDFVAGRLSTSVDFSPMFDQVLVALAMLFVQQLLQNLASLSIVHR